MLSNSFRISRKNLSWEPGMLAQACNPCIWEVEEGGDQKFKVMLDYIMSLRSARDIPDPSLKINKEF